jgi:hypothetical protein
MRTQTCPVLRQPAQLLRPAHRSKARTQTCPLLQAPATTAILPTGEQTGSWPTWACWRMPLRCLAPALAIARAGVLLAVPALAQSGVFESARQVYGTLGPAFYGLRTSLMTLLLMALWRIKRPESLKEHSPAELGRVLGLDRALTAAAEIRQKDDPNWGRDCRGVDHPHPRVELPAPAADRPASMGASHAWPGCRTTLGFEFGPLPASQVGGRPPPPSHTVAERTRSTPLVARNHQFLSV